MTPEKGQVDKISLRDEAKHFGRYAHLTENLIY